MPPIASVLLVFGQGVVRDADGRYTLTPGSSARMRAALDYAAGAGRDRVRRIVFTGGWPEASLGAAQPPDGCCEGDLMLAGAHAAGLGPQIDLCAETRSRSTLENLLHTVEDRLLDGHDFDARQPLGLVSHAWHLPRIRLLAAKILRLRGPALLDVPVRDRTERGREGIIRFGSRLFFLGVTDPATLVRRERALVHTLRRVETITRRRGT